MGNYDLKSRVSELERELSHQQRINNELRHEISIVANGVSRADQQLRDYNNYIQNTLENCDGMMVSSHDKVIAAYEMQGEVEKLYARFKNLELANKKIRACNNKKYYEFGNYRTVRKIVQGMIDNLDVKMVSDNTITKSIEIQHLQVPDYWLTCVLISIMAWKNDDKELSDRSMERALRLDKKNTCIFYMVFNLRIMRDAAALKWFTMYQECDLKGSDQRTFLMLFSLVSKTIAENVNDDTKSQINIYINKVVTDNLKSQGYGEEDITEQICKYFGKMRPSDTVDYPALRKFCSEFDFMADILLNAKNNINILQFIITTINVSPEQKNEYLKGYIDELISAPNQVEEDVYEEIKYNELIIEFQGDIESAKQKYQQEQKRAKDDLNLISEMVNWIYIKDSKNINGQIRLNMFTITKDLQEKAVTRFVDEYRRRIKTTYEIRINEYSTVADFKDETKELNKITTFFTEKKNGLIAEIKNLTTYVAFGASALATVGAFFAGYWLLAVTLICAGFGIGKYLINKTKRKQLEFECQDKIRNTKDILEKMFSEYSDYEKNFTEYDGKYDRIKNEFSKL